MFNWSAWPRLATSELGLIIFRAEEALVFLNKYLVNMLGVKKKPKRDIRVTFFFISFRFFLK
jgi:hypothetical protein